MRSIKDSGSRPDDLETDSGAGRCTPRAGNVELRSNPGLTFLSGQSNDGNHIGVVESGEHSYFFGVARASEFPVLNTDLQPLLSAAYCLRMHVVMRSTSGTSELHNRIASSLHSCCCSAV